MESTTLWQLLAHQNVKRWYVQLLTHLGAGIKRTWISTFSITKLSSKWVFIIFCKYNEWWCIMLSVNVTCKMCCCGHFFTRAKAFHVHVSALWIVMVPLLMYSAHRFKAFPIDKSNSQWHCMAKWVFMMAVDGGSFVCLGGAFSCLLWVLLDRFDSICTPPVSTYYQTAAPPPSTLCHTSNP